MFQYCKISLLSSWDSCVFYQLPPHLPCIMDVGVRSWGVWGVWLDLITSVRELRSAETSQNLLINSEKQTHSQILNFCHSEGIDDHSRLVRKTWTSNEKEEATVMSQENVAPPFCLSAHLLQPQESKALERDSWIHLPSQLYSEIPGKNDRVALSCFLHRSSWNYRPGFVCGVEVRQRWD